MTIRTLVSFLSLLILSISCSKSGSSGNSPGENSPPGSFNLVAVADGSENVDLLPEFSWSRASDPDGDTVTYSIYLDETTNPATRVGQVSNTTNFTLSQSLSRTKRYYWRVVAEDPQGAASSSGTFSFTTRNIRFTSPAQVQNASFSRRRGHSSVVFNDKLWVIGGDIGALTKVNDVWSSSDGITWIPESSGAAFEGRSGFAGLAFQGKLWVIGGRTSGSSSDVDRNDIWMSENGGGWIRITPAAAFTARFGHGFAVFNNKMWIIGGFDGAYKNDVWSSTDGVTWVEESPAAAFDGRVSHRIVVFEDKLWLIGGRNGNGNYRNDIWSSEDGITWTEVNNAASFAGRSLHGAVVIDDKMWVIGGANGSDWRNDVWYSENGVDWTEVSGPVSFTGRLDHSATVFNNQIWVIGGNGSDFQLKNDVYSYD